MIDLIFGLFISIITVIVTVIIIGGILILPLLFKGGWVIYLIVATLALAFWFDNKNREK